MINVKLSFLFMISTTTSRAGGASVASVSRAMRVLDAFASHPAGVALTSLSAELGYGKASLSKILATMVREGFVRRDRVSGHFHLSWRLLALAFGHAQRVGIHGLCSPVLQALADQTDELVQLAVVEDNHVLFVAKAEGPGQQMRMMPLVGVVAPVHATASGKVWLASLPRPEATAVLARQGLPRLASHTITSRERLLAQLRNVRARGYAVVDEELVDGGRAVAAPILKAGHVVGAVAVSGPTFRLPVAKLHRLAPIVRRAAAELEAVWVQDVTARDFGLGVRPPSGNPRARASQAGR
jgi:IclR family transcriptional regulator, acetate operon repressor